MMGLLYALNRLRCKMSCNVETQKTSVMRGRSYVAGTMKGLVRKWCAIGVGIHTLVHSACGKKVVRNRRWHSHSRAFSLW